jgi:cytidine deaminase
MSNMDVNYSVDCKKLVSSSISARCNAHVPYSKFAVGAALLCGNGLIYPGCNIENASFSPSICAERVAIFKAVSEGVTSLAAIAVAGWSINKCEGTEYDYAYPCGVCRQVMMEFVNPNNFQIIVCKSANDYKIYTLAHLLPYGFGPDNLT